MNIWNILLVSTETIWNIWTLAHLWHSSFRRPTSSGGKHVTTAFLCSILYLGWSQYPPSLSMVHPRVPVQVLALETMSINVCQVHRMLNLYRTQRKKKKHDIHWNKSWYQWYQWYQWYPLNNTWSPENFNSPYPSSEKRLTLASPAHFGSVRLPAVGPQRKSLGFQPALREKKVGSLGDRHFHMLIGEYWG